MIFSSVSWLRMWALRSVSSILILLEWCGESWYFLESDSAFLGWHYHRAGWKLEESCSTGRSKRIKGWKVVSFQAEVIQWCFGNFPLCLLKKYFLLPLIGQTRVLYIKLQYLPWIIFLCLHVLGKIFNTKGRLVLTEILISKGSDSLFLSA